MIDRHTDGKVTQVFYSLPNYSPTIKETEFPVFKNSETKISSSPHWEKKKLPNDEICQARSKTTEFLKSWMYLFVIFTVHRSKTSLRKDW